MNKKSQDTYFLLEKVFITDSFTTFTYNVNQKPVKAGIDPMSKFFDRDIDDNMIRVDIEE